MTDDKKRELFPYFAYIYSQQLNPERYGQVESIEDWTNLIQSNQDDIEKITQAAEQLSDEEWDALDQQYTEQAKASEDQQVISAKKGAKLMKLKKGAKKCKCGCDMITAKADGGKLVSKCACGCDVKKKEKGGEINKKIDRVKVAINKKQTGGDINQPNKVVAKKGTKLKPKMQTGGKYNESEHATLIEKYRNKKTSTPELRRLQELNRISGHHDDGWEPKKSKPEAKKPEPTKKPKTEPAKKPIDRIGKHKLGGILKAESGVRVKKISNLEYSRLTPAQKKERANAKRFRDTHKHQYAHVFLENPERWDEDRTNPRRRLDNASYSRLSPEQKAAKLDGVNPYAWIRPSMNIPVAQKIFGTGARDNLLSWLDFISATEVPTPGYRYRTAPPTMLPEVVVTAPRINNQPAPAYDTNTLWGWMKSTGYGDEDTSFAGRRDLWNKFYGSGTTSATGYTGSADQNAKLLDVLKRANAMGLDMDTAANLANPILLKAPNINVPNPKRPEINKFNSAERT